MVKRYKYIKMIKENFINYKMINKYQFKIKMK